MFQNKNNKWPWIGASDKPKTAYSNIMPKITVITPSYMQGQFIEETILSVKRQNYPNLEYLIFDGGSTDNTVDILKKYDDFIDFWVSAPDNGQSNAINKGFQKATGDIICWLNSDDYYYPNTLLKVANYFVTYDDYSMILFGNGDYLLDKYYIHIPNNTTALSEKHPIDLCDYIIQPSSFWGKSVIDKIGLLDENLHFGFDWDWFIKADKANMKFQRVKDKFSCYRIHADHKSSSAGQVRTNEIAKIFKKNHNEVISDTYLKIYENNTKIKFKQFLKHIPVIDVPLSWLYWKLNFKKISFKTFDALRKM